MHDQTHNKLVTGYRRRVTTALDLITLKHICHAHLDEPYRPQRKCDLVNQLIDNWDKVGKPILTLVQDKCTTKQ